MSSINSDYNMPKIKYETMVSNVNTPQSEQRPVKIKAVSESHKIESAQEKTLTIADEYTVKQIEKAIKAMQGPEKSIEMSVHEKTNTIMIKVMNKETGELIREVPSEKALNIFAKFMEINGLLVDERI